MNKRIERDSFGEIEVPAERLWGAQTQRSLQFFHVSTEKMPREIIIALARIKKAAAQVNVGLAKLDANAPSGPWTRQFLELIRDQPGVRAGDICTVVGMERLPFKAYVRKLKALGLTESLEVGYRLSPRGEAVLKAR